MEIDLKNDLLDEEATGGQTHGDAGRLDYGGEHTTQCTDDVIESYT